VNDHSVFVRSRRSWGAIKPDPILAVTETTRIRAAKHSRYGYTLRDTVTGRIWLIVWRGFGFRRNVLL
jgi:hypothetical protein